MLKFTAVLLGMCSIALLLGAEPSSIRAQWLQSLRVDSWHRSGCRGRGVKVAVLDTGFRHYGESLGRSLPPIVQTRSFRIDGNLEARKSQHGILCAEIIHAIAPEAELLFADWQPDSPASFLEAIAWAKRQGARIVTCSVVMPGWSDGEGGGFVHQRSRQLIGHDQLCIACAGNLAKRHWAGRFDPDVNGWHKWSNGTIHNELTPWGDEAVSLEICASHGLFTVFAFDEAGKEVARSRPDTGDCGTVCRFIPRYKAKYSLRLRSTTGGSFHVAALGSWLAQSHEHGSILFPADGSEWFTVGAWEKGHRADYSSCGPNGGEQKPDVVAPVPFASQDRQQPFGGTSAAAPQAAGLSALYWSRYPNASVAEVKAALRSAAKDVGAPGIDNETGWGLLRLPPIN